MSVLIGLWLAKPATALAPKPNNLDLKEDEFVGPIPPTINGTIQPTPRQQSTNRVETRKYAPQTNAGVYSGRSYSKEEVIQLIKDYSEQYGISADLPLRVAACESGYNAYSKNKSSTASGVFQYLRSTWGHTEAGVLGISVYDARANVEMAIKSIASGGISNWNASRGCWST